MRSVAIALAVAAGLGLSACQKAREPANAANESAPAGTSGKGTVAANGAAAPDRPGVGLNGGLGTRSGSTPAASQPAGVADGSTNRTSGGSVGNR